MNETTRETWEETWNAIVEALEYFDSDEAAAEPWPVWQEPEDGRWWGPLFG